MKIEWDGCQFSACVDVYAVSQWACLWNCDQEGNASAASCFILAKMTATLHSLVPISSLLGSILAAYDEIVLLISRDSTPWSSLA